uniref:Uncharacterized protein n=1 Tax=Cannabis sativa TaxID=3483 RepID=A0A803QHW4_CANSA
MRPFAPDKSADLLKPGYTSLGYAFDPQKLSPRVLGYGPSDRASVCTVSKVVSHTMPPCRACVSLCIGLNNPTAWDEGSSNKNGPKVTRVRSQACTTGTI